MPSLNPSLAWREHREAMAARIQSTILGGAERRLAESLFLRPSPIGRPLSSSSSISAMFAAPSAAAAALVRRALATIRGGSAATSSHAAAGGGGDGSGGASSGSLEAQILCALPFCCGFEWQSFGRSPWQGQAFVTVTDGAGIFLCICIRSVRGI